VWRLRSKKTVNATSTAADLALYFDLKYVKEWVNNEPGMPMLSQSCPFERDQSNPVICGLFKPNIYDVFAAAVDAAVDTVIKKVLPSAVDAAITKSIPAAVDAAFKNQHSTGGKRLIQLLINDELVLHWDWIRVVLALLFAAHYARIGNIERLCCQWPDTQKVKWVAAISVGLSVVFNACGGEHVKTGIGKIDGGYERTCKPAASRAFIGTLRAAG
jgi:hypothetical protein